MFTYYLKPTRDGPKLDFAACRWIQTNSQASLKFPVF